MGVLKDEQRKAMQDHLKTILDSQTSSPHSETDLPESSQTTQTSKASRASSGRND